MYECTEALDYGQSLLDRILRCIKFLTGLKHHYFYYSFKVRAKRQGQVKHFQRSAL